MREHHVDVSRVVNQLDRFRFSDDQGPGRPEPYTGANYGYYDPHSNSGYELDTPPPPVYPRRESRQDYYDNCRDGPGSSQTNGYYGDDYSRSYEVRDEYPVRLVHATGVVAETVLGPVHSQPATVWASQTAPATANTTVDENARRAISAIPPSTQNETTKNTRNPSPPAIPHTNGVNLKRLFHKVFDGKRKQLVVGIKKKSIVAKHSIQQGEQKLIHSRKRFLETRNDQNIFGGNSKDSRKYVNPNQQFDSYDYGPQQKHQRSGISTSRISLADPSKEHGHRHHHTDPLNRKQSHPNLQQASSLERPKEALRPSQSQAPLSTPKVQRAPSSYEVYQQRSTEPYHAGNSTFYPDETQYNGVTPMPQQNIAPLQNGLVNLGNTCYMNAVVQALSASDTMTTFFFNSGHTKVLQDRTRQQEINSQVHGSNGAVTKAFGTLLQKMYGNRCTEQDVRDFRAVVGEYSPDYRTYNQQDAQEFLSWLLDKIHEDLNLAKRDNNCNYGSRNGNHSPDEALAERRTAHFSVITNLFEGQFGSSITCNSCFFQKSIFEPYMYVSLPIPHDQKRPLYVTVVRPGCSTITRYGIRVEAKGTISDVRACLCEETKIPNNQMLLLQLTTGGFRNGSAEAAQIANVAGKEAYAVELQPTVDHYSEQYINIVFVLAVRNGAVVLRETEPFVIRISRQCTYETLAKKLFDAAKPCLTPKIHDAVPFGQFKLALANDYNHNTYIDSTVAMPLITPGVEQSIDHNEKSHYNLPKFIKLVIEFPNHNRALIRQAPRVMNHRSADFLASDNASYDLTLESCLKSYTTEESCEWRCERCNGSKPNGAKKRLLFNSCPQILILHLKRFRHVQNEVGEPMKIDVSVKFPAEGLDLKPYVNTSQSLNHRRDSIGNNKINKEMQATVSTAAGDDNLYDLFAVVNHRGDRVSSGHYTATVRNPQDGVWRTFDDTTVTINTDPLEQSENTYLMFYEKRSVRVQRQNSKKNPDSRRLTNALARFTPPREKEPLAPQKSNGLTTDQGAFRRGDATRRAAKAALLPLLHTSKYSSNAQEIPL
ncbi:unnamed protein product, partial [Mesorhabditis spiculigera]